MLRRLAPARTMLAAALLALASLEAVAQRVYNVRFEAHPVLGTVPKAGHTVYFWAEGYGVARYARHGVRRSGPWFEDGPAPVLVLGDSFTEAHQVADAEVFTARLEVQAKVRGINRPVLNLAGSGRSAADYVGQAARVSTLFRPCWTIIQVNDLDFTTDAWDSGKTHFYRDLASGNLRVREVETVRGVPSWMPAFTHHFALTAWTATRLQLLLAAASSGWGFAVRRAVPASVRAEHRSGSRGFPLAEEIAELNAAFGGRLSILYLARYDPRDPWRQTADEEEVARHAAALGIRLVTTRADYPRLASLRLAPFGFSNSRYNWGHLNSIGHQLVADLLTRELVALRAHGLL